MGIKTDTSHHVKAVPPALEAMAAMGFSASDCLAGTDLAEKDLGSGTANIPFTLEQEFRFHRNLLQLTDNPMLGLILGKAYDEMLNACNRNRS